MDCSCSVHTDNDNDDITGYSEINRKNRSLTAVCCECGRKLEIGEDYVFHTIFMVDRIYNAKNCYDCQNIINLFFKDGFTHTQIWDDLDEYFYYNWQDDLPSSCISQLTPIVRDRVCDLFEEIWKQLPKENS